MPESAILPGVRHFPDILMAEAARLHYSQADIDSLDFGPVAYAVRFWPTAYN